jgi:hypothetical protein
MSGTVIALLVVAVLALAVIVIAPWRAVRREGPLPRDVESQLLLGQDPDTDTEEDDEDPLPRPLPFPQRNP